MALGTIFHLAHVNNKTQAKKVKTRLKITKKITTPEVYATGVTRKPVCGDSLNEFREQRPIQR